MEGRGMIERHGFWILALLWLPAGIAAAAAVRFPAGGGPAPEPGAWFAMAAHTVFSLAVVAPCGLALALGCRRLWRLGYRQGAWWAGIALGAITVAASVFAGLLGPVAIAICAVVLSLPIWAAWYWLSRHG